VPFPDELKSLAARVSNWGRWGTDDERGTLNLIDAAAVLRGTACARRGVPFSLSIPMHISGPQTDGPGAPGRMNPTLKMKYVNVSFTGDTDDFTTTDDLVELSLQAATHIDALSHAGYGGLLYNNVPASEITADGAAKLGIEKVGPIVTRGILLDVARSLGVDRLEAGTVIGAKELDATLTSSGLTVLPGDAVLVRTGQMALLAEDRRDDYRIEAPGFGVGAVEWFHDHDVSMVANDTYAFEIYPPEHPEAMMAVHMLDLRDMGLTQGQLWYLDDLAADCAADDVYEFLLSSTPLPVVGAVSGMVAPVAVK
jgi:kynurenine formamidase